MLKLNVNNETSRLKAVVLGTANTNGPAPSLDEAYDPKSAQHIAAGTYPKVEDMVEEMEAVAKVFDKYNVTVYRPKAIEDYNQIFTRDIAARAITIPNSAPASSRSTTGISGCLERITNLDQEAPPLIVLASTIAVRKEKDSMNMPKIRIPIAQLAFSSG